MLVKWVLATFCVIVSTAVVVMWIGHARETLRMERTSASLIQTSLHTGIEIVDFASFEELPPPVARYFRRVLANGQRLIRLAEMRQSGVLRTSTTTDRWSPFTATQLVAPHASSFVWNAKVDMPLATHVRVVDSYIAGAGAGRVSLLSAVVVASESISPELNSGELHRYLAEAVWYPTALLPQSGVLWRPIDDHTAMATLTANGMSVSLEFRFSESGEVAGIYSPGRFRRLDGAYKKVPWEGHFKDYRIQAGMRVPMYGEVGWYDDGILQMVWKGNILEAQYELDS